MLPSLFVLPMTRDYCYFRLLYQVNLTINNTGNYDNLGLSYWHCGPLLYLWFAEPNNYILSMATYNKDMWTFIDQHCARLANIVHIYLCASNCLSDRSNSSVTITTIAVTVPTYLPVNWQWYVTLWGLLIGSIPPVRSMIWKYSMLQAYVWSLGWGLYFISCMFNQLKLMQIYISYVILNNKQHGKVTQSKISF